MEEKVTFDRVFAYWLTSPPVLIVDWDGLVLVWCTWTNLTTVVFS
jgi:hypothetical protein